MSDILAEMNRAENFEPVMTSRQVYIFVNLKQDKFLSQPENISFGEIKS